MKCILWAAVVAVLSAQAHSAEPISLQYHERTGIPKAARIRDAELTEAPSAGRIVGGSPAELGAYPFLAGLVIALTTGHTSVCGSSMLSNSRALTAAHCWWDGRHQATHFVLVFGSTRLFSGGTRVTTSAVEMHSGYRPSNLNNDIAMISFSPVAYTDVIQPVALPSGALLSDDFTGSWAHAAGFGKTSDVSPITVAQVASHVRLRVLSNAVCVQFYGGVVTPATLCTSGAGGTGTCSGDSGGPLVLDQPSSRVLIGVTSFEARRGCEAEWPAGFARVTAFLPWIQARL